MDDNVKLTLVEQALQSDYSKKKLDSVSLRQFINRLLLLSQKSRIFLFYKNDKKGGGWVYSFSTHGDVLFESQFKQQILDKLHKTVKDQRFYKRPKDQLLIWPKAPQEIGKTGFGIILVAIEPKNTENGREITYTSPTNIEPDSTEYKQLKKLWKKFLGRKYSNALGIEARLQKRLEKIHCNPRADFNNINSLHNDTKLLLSDDDRLFINKQLASLSKILDTLYLDVCEAPLISNRGKIPPNLFFFVRYYDQPETINRFKDGSGFSTNQPYPYSLKMVLPETQQRHIEEAFQNIAKSTDNKSDIQTKKKWLYSYKPLDGYEELFPYSDNEYNSHYPQDKLDFEFWSKLKSNKIEEILADIQSPFGKNARSFVDPVLMTGFTHFREGLYKESGLERVTGAEQRKEFRSQDIRRLVYLHYLFSAAAPDSHYDNLGTMTVPLNVARQPYVALVRATVTKGEDDPDYRNEINWPQNYLFYTDIAQHCMSKLRTLSKVRYKREIERLVLNEFKDEFKILGTQKSIHVSLKKIEESLNHKLTLLCRVWPYSRIKLTIINAAKGPYENYLPLINSLDFTTGIFFEVQNNPFYLGEDKQELCLTKESATVSLSTQEVKRVLGRALSRLEEAIAIKILKHNQHRPLH